MLGPVGGAADAESALALLHLLLGRRGRIRFIRPEARPLRPPRARHRTGPHAPGLTQPGSTFSHCHFTGPRNRFLRAQSRAADAGFVSLS